MKPPLPGSFSARLMVAVSTIAFMISDFLYINQLGDPGQALLAASFFIPVLALVISVRLGALLWIALASISLFVLPIEPDQFAVAGMAGIVLTCVVVYRLPWQEWAMFGIIFLLYLVAHTISFGFGWPFIRASTICITLICITGVSLSRYRKKLLQVSKHVEMLQKTQKEARAEERTAIAHELHDIVGHDITAIVMQARRARFLEAEKKDEILDLIGKAGHSTLEDLRRMLMVLRHTEDSDAASNSPERGAPVNLMDDSAETAAISPRGLIEVQERLVEVLRGAGMQVDLEVSGDLTSIPTAIQGTMRRILRELGTNILKHADPSHPVLVRMMVKETEVTVRINNHMGLSKPIMSSGTGLEALRARVGVYDGRFSTGVTADREWVALVWLPFPR